MSFSSGSSSSPVGLEPEPASVPTPTPDPDDEGEDEVPGPSDASAVAFVAALDEAGDAQDEQLVTDSESGADQLLSTAFPDGLPDPFSPAEGGWTSGGQDVDAYTGAAASGGPLSPYAGLDADPYTAVAGSDANANAFTGGQDVDPFTGTGAGASLLSSRDLLAANDIGTSVNSNVASDVGGPTYIGPTDAAGTGVSANTDWTPQVSDVAGGSVYIGAFTENGVTYLQFSDIDGWTYEVPAPPNTAPSAAPAGTPPAADPATSPPAASPPASPPPSPPPSAPAPPPSPPPTPQPAAAQMPPQVQAPPQAPADSAGPAPTPPPDPPPAPPAQPQNQPAAAPPSAPSPLPYDPMADSPFAKWLLYGNNTPVRDFLTNDTHLQTVQNVALGVSVTAATIATGGMLLEAAPGALTTLGAGAQSGSLLTAAAPLASAGAGIVASNPNLPEELEELEGALPTLASELGTFAPEVEENLPAVASSTNASALLQNTASYLGKTPISNLTAQWAQYQARVTGTDEESVFTLIRNGVEKTVRADDFVDGYLIEAKASGFTGQMWRDGGAAVMEQAKNYVDLANTIGANGIRYYVQNPGEMANLITRLNLDFPAAMASGQIQVFLKP